MAEQSQPVDEPTPGRDLGVDRETRVRSCCARVDGVWCILPDGHRGDHVVVNPKKAVP